LSLSKTGASRLLLGLIILLIVLGAAAAVYTLRSNPVEDAIAANRVINILFVIEEEKRPVSTYVLMYYPGTKRAAIFDIPGNLGLLITKIDRVDRIDKVYDSSRIGSYESEIEKLMGIDINFAIVITKENLVSIVDLVEGVEIFIPTPVSYRDGGKVIRFPSGITVLDGDKAGVYATYSLPDEDSEMEVFRRHRFFLGLLNRQIQLNDKLENPAVAKMYYSFFRTSMNQRTLTRLFREFVHIDTNRVNILSVSGSLKEVSGQMLFFPRLDGIVKEVVSQTYGALTSEKEEYYIDNNLTVEVLNGTAVNGLAGRTADMLRSFNYDIISIGNADRNNYENTVIYHFSGDDAMVKDFADVIKCENVIDETNDGQEDQTNKQPSDIKSADIKSADFKADIRLIIGRDFNGRNVIKN
jgi:polyisoprenyl-teichoic acid--peptidoglycan teichoic acid transferase